MNERSELYRINYSYIVLNYQWLNDQEKMFVIYIIYFLGQVLRKIF